LIKKVIREPLTLDFDLDDPRTTHLRSNILRHKKNLRQIYEEWYKRILGSLPPEAIYILEIGSGPGFLSEFIPNLISSDIFPIPKINVIIDGRYLPIQESTMDAVVMVNVLHHISEPRLLIHEVGRCVKAGGVMTMVEPWVTLWSKFVYRFLHHEQFEPQRLEWEFRQTGPLSDANGALPWIIFQRDRYVFDHEFPEWNLEKIAMERPFTYLLSGGFSIRNIVPVFLFQLCLKLEQLLSPLNKHLAMFAIITLRRTEN
jgi:SAM-dependent methyltransferase